GADAVEGTSERVSVDLAGSLVGGDALPGSLDACLAALCARYGWEERRPRLLRAEEVLFAADLDRAVARADVDLAIDRTGRITVQSCDLSDSAGMRLIQLSGLVVGAGEAPEELAVDGAVVGGGSAGGGRRAEMAGWKIGRAHVRTPVTFRVRMP